MAGERPLPRYVLPQELLAVGSRTGERTALGAWVVKHVSRQGLAAPPPGLPELVHRHGLPPGTAAPAPCQGAAGGHLAPAAHTVPASVHVDPPAVHPTADPEPCRFGRVEQPCGGPDDRPERGGEVFAQPVPGELYPRPL